MDSQGENVSSMDEEERASLEVALKSGSLSTVLDAIDHVVEAREGRVSKQARRQVWQKPLSESDIERLQQLEEKMNEFVQKHVLDRVELNEPRELTQSEVDRLAEEYRDWEQINDVLQARYGMWRKMVFASLTAKYEQDLAEGRVNSDKPAAQMQGKLISQSHHLAFCREGGNRKAPEVNWGLLEKLLDRGTYEKLCEVEEVPEQVIPAHTKYTPSTQKLMDALVSGMVGLETMREALVPGKWQTPKFQVRKL